MAKGGTKSRCIFYKDGRILLCKIIGHSYYFFPGGTNENETPEDCLTREIKEEFSSGVANLKFLVKFVNKYTFKNVDYEEVIYMFEGEFTDQSMYSKDKIPLADQKEIVAEWVSVQDIKNGVVSIKPEKDYLSMIKL